MARLAAFPKAWLDALCVDGTMTVEQWIDLSLTFDIDGLEFYAGFIGVDNPARVRAWRDRVEAQGRSIPMLCCSPDFTHPDPQFRQVQINREKRWIDLTAQLGGGYCRILSGQRRPEVAHADGVRFTVEAINACRAHAIEQGVTLILENHYKDGFWTYPEFAQSTAVFLEIVQQIPPGPGFGVNFDPSNCIVCGEDPIPLLEAVAGRVVTMHASDRYFADGGLAELQARALEPHTGYASILRHGVIGRGLNDYDRIFSLLRAAGFNGWISIEDGADPATSADDIRQSAIFLREKMARHGLARSSA